MIFVTIGVSVKFDRLIREMDAIASRLDEKVVMQIGYSDYRPRNADYFKFLPIEEVEEYYKASRLIVCHAGSGTIITAMKYNKRMILVPRYKKYEEVCDDHQLEIADAMEKEGKAVIVRDIGQLESAIKDIDRYFTAGPSIKNEADAGLVNSLREYLSTMWPN